MIKFHTNLDKYKTNCWPNNLLHLPRVGDFIQVVKAFHSYYLERKLPIRLQVVSVTHTESCVFCELWLNELDAKQLKQNGISIFD